MPDPDHKTCTKCGEVKPLSAFSKDGSRPDGLRVHCKVCVSAINKAYQKANRDKVVARQRTYYAANRDKVVARKRAYRMKNRHKTRAHDLVNKALARGDLLRQPCERCGATEPVDAHHEDYSKPLDVVWLCRSCHAQRHVELAEQEREHD